MYYPKQRQLTINREKVEKSSNKKFLCVYEESIEIAYKMLSKSAFQVWLYLICNRDNYDLEYSTAHISKITGMSIETARKAFLELENKAYIISKNDSNVYYNFYEIPQEQKQKKEIVNPYTGEILYMDYKQTVEMFGYIIGISLWGGNYYEYKN